MRLTLEQKMKMCEEHVLKGKSISHASEMYGGYDIGNLKYLINIYKRYGRDAFLNRENGVYKRDTKLLGISRVEHGESIRSVALDLGLIDPSILGDWVRKYQTWHHQCIIITQVNTNRKQTNMRIRERNRLSVSEET